MVHCSQHSTIHSQSFLPSEQLLPWQQWTFSQYQSPKQPQQQSSRGESGDYSFITVTPSPVAPCSQPGQLQMCSPFPYARKQQLLSKLRGECPSCFYRVVHWETKANWQGVYSQIANGERSLELGSASKLLGEGALASTDPAHSFLTNGQRLPQPTGSG